MLKISLACSNDEHGISGYRVAINVIPEDDNADEARLMDDSVEATCAALPTSHPYAAELRAFIQAVHDATATETWKNAEFWDNRG